MSEEPKPPRQRKAMLYAAAAFVVLMAAMFLWKEASLFRLERKLEARCEVQRAEMALERSRIQDTAVARVSELLELFSLPLAWAVRAEALRDDYGHIEEYMLQLVKRPAVQSVTFVDRDGLVRLATDRKLQGAPAAPVFGDLLTNEEATLRSVDRELRLMVPVFGYSERVGSLIVIFAREALLHPFEERDQT